ncbi:major facilitator superfamily [Moniliophthora roreri MCA 2997]|uniref:Major facilitator superfamily n=1 Tax=Moniliophthora roreri (strain MCA 2997) TaxID=1381753 RepID=V2X797_MONRO|nr:major facilitator superfamily [Moniliophthora roreri MCA 2997]
MQKHSTTPTVAVSNQNNGNDAQDAAERGENRIKVPETKRPYSIYTKREKWILVIMIASSGLFSPLTANVYFPAIPTLARVFNKSVELINLTVTMYMVFQGISPMLFGTLADNVGRRLIYATCLLILCLSCVGLALVPTNAYWLLLLLRCIQSAGSASTIALGAGVIGDIADASERGGFYGIFQSGPLLGPSIGPVIGGLLAGSLGWRSIFWFLCISSGVAFILIILFLPETLRAIVGDGSIQPPIYLRPVIPILGRRKKQATGAAQDQALPPKKAFKNPFALLKHLDITILLIFNGWIVAVYYAVTATISTVFASAYPFLNETDIGLCFLSIGGGMLAGSVLSGQFLDSEYHRFLRKMYPNLDSKEAKENVRKDEKFPIEEARLRFLPAVMIIYVGCILGYGWCIEEQVHIAVPLVLHFFIGFTAIFSATCASTLCIDYVPEQSSSVTACNNLIRGSLGAMLVAVIDLMIRRLTVGWAFVLLGCLCAVMTPSVYAVIRLGPHFRAKRRAQREKQ